jgi:hypothetical protein
MSFLRRLLGGAQGNGQAEQATPEPPATAAELEEAERQHELDVLRGEAARLSELQQRQLRYADRAWTPPRQGGERRADDEDAPPSE